MLISEARLKSLSKKQIEQLLDRIDALKQRHRAEQFKLLSKFFPSMTLQDMDEQEEMEEEHQKEKEKVKKTKKKGCLDISMSSDSDEE